VILSILTCSALVGCGGDDAPAEPPDFRTAANKVCREHNVQVDEVRDRLRGKQVTLGDAVDAIRDEATVKEDQLQDLRDLKPPADAKPYLARLARNTKGLRRAADEVEADRGESYIAFWATLQNSEDAANKLAEPLGLEDCSPPVAQ
jgi:hypothetical protein